MGQIIHLLVVDKVIVLWSNQSGTLEKWITITSFELNWRPTVRGLYHWPPHELGAVYASGIRFPNCWDFKNEHCIPLRFGQKFESLWHLVKTIIRPMQKAWAANSAEPRDPRFAGGKSIIIKRFHHQTRRREVEHFWQPCIFRRCSDVRSPVYMNQSQNKIVGHINAEVLDEYTI